MPKPLPPAYVKMPGKPKTERRREPGEAPKGTKLSRKGIKMTCRLCRKSTHNARKCPLNPEAGKKKNAYIKRDAARQKKKEREASDKKKKRQPVVSYVICKLMLHYNYI